MRGIFNTTMQSMSNLVTRSHSFLRHDRGDVPGWVLVAVMTAGLVTALWMVADTQLTSVLTKAINSVTK